MLIYLFKQTLNFWRQLGRWTQAETLLLAGLLYVYAAERLILFLPHIMAFLSLNLWQLSWVMLHGYVFILLVTAPFIWYFALPRQQTLAVFYGRPLHNRHLMELLGYYFQKFQLLSLLFFLPLLFAIAYINPLAGVVLLLLTIGYSLAVIIVSFRMFVLLRKKISFFAVLYLLAVLQGAIGALAGWYFTAVPLLDVLFLGAAGVLWRKMLAVPKQMSLEELYPLSGKRFSAKSGGCLRLDSLPRILPRRLQVLFAKEFLNLWRNPAYRRLKLYTLLLYFGGQWLIYRSGRADRDMWMILLGLAVIWLHYAQYFNVKYLRPDPQWLFYTEALRFSHFWLAGFLTEFLFVLILLAGQSAFLLLTGSGWLVQLNWLGLLLLFALVVLVVMLNFRIYFYDSPRTAGYAYHFMVLFFTVMSLNYRLVGPVVAVLFLMYFTYKSYRFFNG